MQDLRQDKHEFGPAEEELIGRIRDLLARENLGSALDLFNTLHPVDQGDVLVELPADSQEALLASNSPEDSADILQHLDREEAVQVSERMEPEVLADILDEARPEVAADVLRHISAEHSRETLQAMEEADDVAPLLDYADDVAGGLMTPDYPIVSQGTTVSMALDTLRLFGPDAEHISSILVVDAVGKLMGDVGLARLALARTGAAMSDLVETDVVSVAVEADQEHCVRLMERYSLGVLPVVDGESHLIGVILAEELVDVAEEEATEDMYKIASVGGETVFGPLRNSTRRRLPWLYINLVTAFLVAAVIGLFESTIAEVVTLAVFLPLVPAQGGMGGVQTLTLVVRSMALGEIPDRRALRLMLRELYLGVVQGLMLAIAVGLVAYAWKGNLMLGLILGLAMLGNMLVAGLTGAGVPLLLRKLRLDPAVSAAVFVTTFTDVVGVFLFLGLASILVGSLR